MFSMNVFIGKITIHSLILFQSKLHVVCIFQDTKWVVYGIYQVSQDTGSKHLYIVSRNYLILTFNVSACSYDKLVC